MIVRLLTILAMTLPLAACAAQPAHGDAAAAAAPVQVAPAAAAPAATASPSVPVSTPAAQDAAQPAGAGGTQAGAATATATPGAVRHVPSGASNGRAMASDAPAAAAPAAATDAPVMQQPAPGVVTPGVTTPNVATPNTPVTMPSGSPTGSLMQTLFALVLVLAVLAALAWFLKRYGPRGAGGSTANLRIVGSLGLGGRERLLVVEVGNQWIVVGASPGRVNALATMPKQDAASAPGTEGGAALAPHGPAAHSFADWLRQTMDKRK